MGHRKKHAPKRGSLSYSPRKRAKNILARIRHWPKIEAGTPTLLGFIGYKAGMTHVFAVEDRKRSPNYGKEVSKSATVLEAPPMIVCAIRVYTKNSYGLQTLTEVWMKNPPKELERIFPLPENFNMDENLRKIKENLEKVTRIRVIAITQPKQTSVPKKKPDVMEIELGGGTVQEQFEYANTLLGKPVPLGDVFKEGQYIDAVAVTTGKGFQGPVKRWGVRILQHKARKTKRGVGTLGPWKPAHIMPSVPRAGQMGFHQRTELNKRIIKIGTDGKEVTPNGGFIRYGIIHGYYILLDGSIPGPEKRPIKLRYPTRPPKHIPEQPPQTTYISLEPPQGK
ncbi:50S ribosomal protein L3 [Candidatus Bathyarchaeota archaeon]|nr:50S ribosomal protein L3 [Candidatus Bathyarchaeota archaeon]MCK4434151.1 50S ribosomal protein L3 [Candidatus Bathyarchaeota archaeon]MCK4669232.1 50S ribosomal protein L3 [Candidatus Bathyarchaeota archaeon]